MPDLTHDWTLTTADDDWEAGGSAPEAGHHIEVRRVETLCEERL